jgi:Transposase DDE domain
MWNPPIALTPDEQKIAVRTRKTRKFFVFLREHRHELLDADFQDTLAHSYRAEPGGQAPVEAGLLALATLLQAYGHVGDRDAVELTVMDKRGQLGLDCLGAEQPPCSQGTLCNFRMRLIAHNLDKTLLDRTVALAETTGGFGARQLRAVLASTPLFGASRGEDTLHLLGHALRQAVGLAAQDLGTSAEAVVEDAGLVLVGHSRLKAVLDLDGGEPRARACALGLVLEEVARWQRWLAQQQTLAAEPPPLQEVMESITQMIAQDTEPDPGGGPGGRRLKPHVTPDRRLSIEDKDRRHGRKSSAKTFNGCKEHFAVDLESTVIREVVIRPAHEPEHEAVERLAAALAKAPGLLQLDIALGDMASPRLAQWAEQGVDIIARPWPQGGPLCTQHDFTLDFAGMQGTCPGGQSVPMVLGKPAQVPAAACAVCALRTQCTKATRGQGRSLSIRADEPFQQKLRAKMQTQRGRAALRTRTAVEHTIAHQLVHQGRRARYKGWRQNQCDGRRHAAVSNLQVAAHYAEEHRLAS